jgi:hypothetical protein
MTFGFIPKEANRGPAEESSRYLDWCEIAESPTQLLLGFVAERSVHYSEYATGC